MSEYGDIWYVVEMGLVQHRALEFLINVSLFSIFVKLRTPSYCSQLQPSAVGSPWPQESMPSPPPDPPSFDLIRGLGSAPPAARWLSSPRIRLLTGMVALR